MSEIKVELAFRGEMLVLYPKAMILDRGTSSGSDLIGQ